MFLTKKIFLSLGGNQGTVLQNLKEAFRLLTLQTEFSQFSLSSFYQTEPIEVNTEDWFINAVCSFYTHSTAQEVFEITQKIEEKIGKVKKAKTESRPIDIDILFYGTEIYQDFNLQIPHLHWQERLFVLMPLLDLTPSICIEQDKQAWVYDIKELIFKINKNSPQKVILIKDNAI